MSLFMTVVSFVIYVSHLGSNDPKRHWDWQLASSPTGENPRLIYRSFARLRIEKVGFQAVPFTPLPGHGIIVRQPVS